MTMRCEISSSLASTPLLSWWKVGVYPCVLVMQVHPDTTCSVPFLVLNEKKKLMLSPLHFLHHEAPSPGDSWLPENTCASAKIEFPMKKWVHVGCEVCYTHFANFWKFVIHNWSSPAAFIIKRVCNHGGNTFKNLVFLSSQYFSYSRGSHCWFVILYIFLLYETFELFRYLNYWEISEFTC